MSIEQNTFAEACYDMNSIAELEVALANEPDETDMKEWNLASDEWREQIEIALNELKSDEKAKKI